MFYDDENFFCDNPGSNGGSAKKNTKKRNANAKRAATRVRKAGGSVRAQIRAREAVRRG